MKVYISGGMRGYPAFNHPAFDAAAEELRRRGHEVFNPAEHDRAVHDDLTPENAAEKGFDLRKALAADLTWITLEADGVAVLDGWQSSRGARAEVATALALGLLVQPVESFGVSDAWRITELPPMPDATAEAQSVVRDAIQEHLNQNYPHLAPLYGEPLLEPFDDDEYDEAPPRETVRDNPFDGVTVVRWADESPENEQPPETRGTWRRWEAARAEAFADREVRTTSSTGAQKGVKPARMSLIPSYPLMLVAEHYAAGARKYSAWNWRSGYEFSKSLDAMLRHAYQFADGEDNDPETGTSHLCAVVFHAFTLLQGLRDWPQFDDRYKQEAA